MSSVVWRKWAIGALAAAPVAVFVLDNIVSLQMISGRSMQPALNPDSNRLWRDVVILDRMVRGDMTSRLKRGDLITFTSPFDPDKLLVKRIIALPHDCVVPLINKKSFVRVPKGQCWVEGDESFHSSDSNSFGPIPLALVHGRVFAFVWPWWRVGQSVSGMPEWKKRRVFVNGTVRLSQKPN